MKKIRGAALLTALILAVNLGMSGIVVRADETAGGLPVEENADGRLLEGEPGSEEPGQPVEGVGGNPAELKESTDEEPAEPEGGISNDPAEPEEGSPNDSAESEEETSSNPAESENSDLEEFGESLWDESSLETGTESGEVMSDENTEESLDEEEIPDEESGSEDSLEESADSSPLLGAFPGMVTKLPAQGMYAIICAADTSYALGTAGDKTAYGTQIITQKWDKRPTEAWIIRKAQGNYYYIKSGMNHFTSSETTATIGRSSGTDLSLMAGWTSGSSPEEELWQFTFDSEGKCRIRHKVTGQVLDVTGGTPGKNVKLQLHKSNDTAAQRFYIVDLTTHAVAYTVQNRTSADDLGRNTLEIANLNSPSLDQNKMATAQSLINVRAGSGVKVEAVGGFANKCNWALASDGRTLLPAYRATMSAAGFGSEDEFIEVTYPEAGSFYDGVKTVRAGARVRFSQIVPADRLCQKYDWTSAPPADGNKYLTIATNLFGGFWFNNIEKMDVRVTFFDAETGAELPMTDAYLTFNSLSNNMDGEQYTSGHDIAYPASDAYGEFVGIKDRAVTGYVSGTLGSVASAQGEAVTNIVSMDLEIWPPYADERYNAGTQPVFIGQARRYGGGSAYKQAAWTDSLGGTNFTRNSVSLPLDGASTTFVMGTMKGEAWMSFSSAPIYASVEPPHKSISDASGPASSFNSESARIPLKGGSATFTVTQKVPQIGFDTAEALETLTVTDEIDPRLVIEEVTVGDGLPWTYSVSGQIVTFTYTGNYRERLDSGSGTVDDGQAVTEGRFLIKVRPSDSAASGDVIPNTAVTHWRRTSGGDESAESETVTVTPFDAVMGTGVEILDAGGGGGLLILLGGVMVILLSAIFRVRLLRD